MALDISTFIDIRTNIQVGGAPRRTFGRGLLLTTDDSLSAAGDGKARLFNSIADVEDALGTGDALDAATVWVSADPQPQGLYIGRWATADVSTSLTGGTPDAANTFTAANYSFAINGVDITPIDLSSATTFAAIATAITAVLAATTGFAGSTVAYASNAFTITLAGQGAINPAYLTATGVGTALEGKLAMAQADNPTYVQGHSQESATAAANEIVGLVTSPPVAVMRAGDTPATDPVTSASTDSGLAAWAQAGDYMYGLLDTSAAVLSAADTTSEGYLAFSRNQGQVLAAYADDADKRGDVAGLAMLSSQNLGGLQTIISLHGKPAPGVAASAIDVTQYEVLESKRVNTVASVAGQTRFLGGYSSRAGYWADAQWWVLWIKNELELALWNIQGSSRRVNAGIITDTVTQVAQRGVLNGGIQPNGTVNASTRSDIIAYTGITDFGGTLTTGYMLWVEPASVQTDTDRANRVGRFRLWAAPSPAIHKVIGDLTLSG